jgi:hypothetical protein
MAEKSRRSSEGFEDVLDREPDIRVEPMFGDVNLLRAALLSGATPPCLYRTERPVQQMP